jgi:cobalt-precorrin-5B (C1)-methyltransferase
VIHAACSANPGCDILSPAMSAHDILDLTQPTEAGLLRGYTTGACAAAGAYACTLLWLGVVPPPAIILPLISKPERIRIPVESVEREPDGGCRAVVVKDSGDDPDVTHRARIIVRVRSRQDGTPGVRFFRGSGVGLVTRPGLALPPGEPAINPGPRQMIASAIALATEELSAASSATPSGWDVEIGVEGGDLLAHRTFNPRLGIEGGLSILGTTGLVEPKSHEAFVGAIHSYLGVALAPPVEQIALVPGNLGQAWARSELRLPDYRIVQISNFLGESLDLLGSTLSSRCVTLPKLWIAGHPGKLVKVLEGCWDTHSHRAPMPRRALEKALLALCPSRRDLAQACHEINTVQEWIERLDHEPDFSGLFWASITRQIEEAISARIPHGVAEVRVRLFSLTGQALTE